MSVTSSLARRWGFSSSKTTSTQHVPSYQPFEEPSDVECMAPGDTCEPLFTQPSNCDSAIQYATSDDLAGAQHPWTPLLSSTLQSDKPAPQIMPIATTTSASVAYWEQHQANSAIFNVGLLADSDAASKQPVRCAAVDLAGLSGWFQLLVDHVGCLSGTDLSAVVIPCEIARDLLQQLVRSIYCQELEITADNVEALYRAADAMHVSIKASSATE